MDLLELQNRNRELSILNTVAQQLNRETVLQEALQVTLQHTVELLHLQTGWIWLFPSGEGHAYLAASFNLPPILRQQPELLSGSRYCYCLEKYGKGDLKQALNISEITCTRLKDLSEGTSNLRYHASIPLISGASKLGLLNVVSPQLQKLSADQLRLLYTIGDMLSIAIERARLFESSQQLGAIEERNRLAREIHDTLAQGLSGISLRLETLDALLEKTNSQQQLREQIQKLQQLTKSNLEEARRSVLDLRATPLQKNELPTALQELLQEASCQSEFQVIGTYRKLPIRHEMGLYRIAQEAIMNCRRHAQAEKIVLQLSYHTNGVVLEITDDGLGFDAEQIEKEGFGLIGINERVKLLNGTLEINSSIGKGTHLKVTLEHS